MTRRTTRKTEDSRSNDTVGKKRKKTAGKKREKTARKKKNHASEEPKDSARETALKPTPEPTPDLTPELTREPTEPPRPVLTEQDALTLAEALVEMFNEGAEHPVAFFVSGNEALGRHIIRLQGGEEEDADGWVPVVLDAAQVHRYGMLTIADEMMWRGASEGEVFEDDR